MVEKAVYFVLLTNELFATLYDSKKRWVKNVTMNDLSEVDNSLSNLC